MNPQQLKRAIRWRAEGWKYDKIATRLGVSRSALYRAINGSEVREREPTPLRTAKEELADAHSPAQRACVLANFGDILERTTDGTAE